VDTPDLIKIVTEAEPEATRRELDFAARAFDYVKEAGVVIDYPHRIVIRRDDGTRDLPSPRLQLRWNDDENVCHYELILPLNRDDCRRDSPLNPVPSGFLAIPLGRTTRSGGSGAIQYDGTVSVPFRDGRHIERDADKLKLPAFAIAGDVVTEINNPASSHHY
jgi:hypothetical protein